MLLLLLYLFLYLLLGAALVAIRICGAIPSVRKTNFKVQWLIYSIIIYILRLFIPVICLLYLSIVCCRKKRNSQYPLNTTTSFTVPNEFTDQEDEHLIIRQGTKIPSKDYKSIFAVTNALVHICVMSSYIVKAVICAGMYQLFV